MKFSLKISKYFSLKICFLFIICINLLLLAIYFGIKYDFQVPVINKSLISKNQIEKLENENANLNNNSEIYKTIHKSIRQGFRPAKIVFSGYTPAGYGNKMYGLLTSLVIAMLTDSALIIKWKDIGDYVQEPLYLSFYNEGNSEANAFDPEYDSKNIYALPRPTRFAWMNNKNMSEMIKTRLPTNFTRISYEHYEAYFYEICSNPMYYEKLFFYNLVKRETIDRAFEITNNMDKYSNDVMQNDILKIGFEVGGNLQRKFWKPKDYILRQVEEYILKFFKENFVIGIQLRSDRINLYEDFNVYLMCALSIEINLIKDKIHSFKTVKWFVVSDDVSYLNRVMEDYMDKVITTNGTIAHVGSDPSGYERVLLEQELLSHCNELIVSGGSSYGFLPAMKSLKMPYYVNGNLRMQKCLRLDFISYSSRGNISLI